MTISAVKKDCITTECESYFFPTGQLYFAWQIITRFLAYENITRELKLEFFKHMVKQSKSTVLNI